MAGINKAIIVGRLGRDPEIMYSQQGLAIVKLAVATSETWIDKNTNERQERTEWHRITVFGKQAENCERFLSKGRQVYVEGRLQTSSYEKEGQTHYSTDIIANTVQFLGDKNDGGGSYGGGGGQGGGYAQRQAPQANQGGQGGGYQQRPASNPGGGYQGGGGGFSSPTSPGATPPSDPGSAPSMPPEDDIPF